VTAETPARPAADVAGLLDPFGPAWVEDPYRVFAAARPEGRVFHSESLGYWLVTRYEDVKAVLHDTERFSADVATAPLMPPGERAVKKLQAAGFCPVRTLTDNDPPGHGRVRRLVNRAFTPKRVQWLEPHIRRLATEHIDRLGVPDGGTAEVDLVAGLTYPLPALVIFLLIGVPESYLRAVKDGSTHRVTLICGRPSDDDQERAAEGMGDFWQLCRSIIEDRMETPRDDFPSALIAAREGDHAALTLEELTTLAFGQLFAGHETTTGHLTNAVRHILGRPGTWERLRADPGRIPAVVEEALRIDPPVINWRRRAKVDVRLGDVDVPAGAKLLLLLGSANHDAAVFDDPETFDPDRPNAREHLAFGFGEHTCLGASLARLESRVVLEELLGRFPAASLPAQELDYLPNILFRAPRGLKVRLTAGPAAGEPAE
jgi:cytochrome P450